VDAALVQSLKLAVVEATGLSKDALHVHVGLLVFLGTALIGRRPLQSATPWMAVLLVALLGEAIDLRSDLAETGHLRWGASVHDLINTLFWPTVLLVGLRFGRGVLEPRR
jgi:hypothetical protein